MHVQRHRPHSGGENMRQLEDNLGSLGWRLTPSEIKSSIAPPKRLVNRRRKTSSKRRDGTVSFNSIIICSLLRLQNDERETRVIRLFDYSIIQSVQTGARRVRLRR